MGRLKKSTVEHYAAEARRLVNLDPTEVEQIRDDQLAKLDMIVVAALAKKEFRTAVAAIETASRIAGTQATQRHEVVASLLVSPLWLDAPHQDPARARALPDRAQRRARRALRGGSHADARAARDERRAASRPTRSRA